MRIFESPEKPVHQLNSEFRSKILQGVRLNFLHFKSSYTESENEKRERYLDKLHLTLHKMTQLLGGSIEERSLEAGDFFVLAGPSSEVEQARAVHFKFITETWY